MYKRVQVIVNPAAGKDTPILGILNKVFSEAEVDWDVYVTKGPGDAHRFAREAVSAGVDVVAVNGGDGTLMEVASGLMDTNIPMAILPGGTANVMSIELAIPSDIAEACALVTADDLGTVRPVDMGLVGKHTFMLRVGMGLEAAMVQGADRDMKSRVGSLAYVLSALQAFNNPQLARYLLTLDGKEIEVEGITCMVANSGNLGSPGLRMAPNIDVSDGLLDVIVIRRGDLGALLSVAASVVAGNENAEPLQHWQARNIRVVAAPVQPVQVDGEMLTQTPVEVKVLPQILKVIVPRPKLAPEWLPARADTDTAPGLLGAAPAIG
jgi:YegS/Rv2252/BmrU family lipid kinase